MIELRSWDKAGFTNIEKRSVNERSHSTDGSLARFDSVQSNFSLFSVKLPSRSCVGCMSSEFGGYLVKAIAEAKLALDSIEDGRTQLVVSRSRLPSGSDEAVEMLMHADGHIVRLRPRGG
jgi:hypothetical protein